MVASLAAVWTGGVRPCFPAAGLFAAAFFLVAAWLPGVPGKSGIVSATLWFVVPVALLFLISLRTPLFAERYVMYAAPAFYVLVGAGFAAAWSRWKWAAIALAAVGLAVAAAGIGVQATTPIKSDWRAAAAYVRDNAAPRDSIVFVMPHGETVFRYYWRTELAVFDAPYTNNGETETGIDRSLSASTASSGPVWLVLSEPEQWDRRGLILAWFERNWKADMSASFQGVEVLRFAR
jgi:hypothetical protein